MKRGLPNPSIRAAGFVEPKPHGVLERFWWHLKGLFLPREQWEVCETFAFLFKDGRFIRVILGFLFDGGTIPRFLWFLIGPPIQAACLVGFAVHDGLCRSGLVPRAEADAKLREVLLAYGVNRVKVWLIFKAVLAAGKVTNGPSEKQKAEARKFIHLHDKKEGGGNEGI